MTIRVRPFITAGMLTAALLVAGCGDGGGEGDETQSTEPTTQATEPALTAPPTQTPEEEAEAEIIGTFETLITRLDDYRSTAGEYGNDGDPTWNAILVGDLRTKAGAEMELTNQVGAWKRSEIEQVGDTVIVAHDVVEVTLDVTDSGIHEAESTACMDMTGLEYVTYDGQPAELPAKPAQYQTWTMTWTYQPSAAPDSGIDEPGWYLSNFDLTVNEPC